MAARYWISGSQTWNRTNTAVWSATPGGGGGASVPTSEDDVYFQNPGTYTVTVADINGSVSCKSLNFTGFTGTLAGSTTLNLYGSLTAVAGMTWTHTGAIFFSATGAVTLTSGGKTLGPISVSSMSVTVELQAALTSSGAITVAAGTFITNDYSVTAVAISSSNTNVRTIILGSSTVTLSGSSPTDWSLGINLVFDAGASQINCSNVGPIIVGTPGLNNVSLTNTGLGTASFVPGGSFYNLTVAGRSTAGVGTIALLGNQTIYGTLTLSAGTHAGMRTFVRSDLVGTTRTLTCGTVAPLTDVDFRDITIAGAAAPVAGTRLGDCKGNSGVTFPAAKTVYFTAAGGTWGTSLVWSFTFGGTGDNTAFPLAQDTALFPALYPSSGQTVGLDGSYNLGSVILSLRTANTMTLSLSNNSIYGNWVFGTGASVSGLATITFAGRGSQTITSAGRTFTQSIGIDSPGGSVTLQDAFSSNRANSQGFQLRAGTFDLSIYTATFSGSTLGFRVDQTSTARTLATGTGTLIIAGSTGFQSAAIGFTVTGTGTISMTSASAKTFAGSGIQTYPTINQGGSGQLTITGSNKFANITNTYAATGPTTVLFTFGTTNEFTAFNLTGQATRVCTLGSTSASQATLKKGAAWLVGANSTNGGNNTGLTFAAGGGIDYLSISYINGTLLSSLIDAYIVESATSADTSAAKAVFVSALGESATAAEVVGVINLYLRSVSESVTATDLVAATRSFARSISELTQASETGAATKAMSATVAETVRPIDTANAGLLYLSSISEATTASEIAAAARAFNAAVLEATSASEITAAQAAFLAVVPEHVSGSDVLAAFATLNGSVSELAAAADAARRAKVKFVDLENYVATEATTTALSVEASVTSNTASGTVESGQITATVLP